MTKVSSFVAPVAEKAGEMRRGSRIQPYIPPDLFRKLRAYAAVNEQTVTAVIAATLQEYLERDEVEDALLVRRLDGVTQAIGQLQRDVDTLAAGFGRFVRVSLYSAPENLTDQTIRRAEALYSTFLERVHEQLRDGVKFTGLVWRARGKVASPPLNPAPGTGGGEGGERP
jgi:hypothetical protein